MNSACFLMNNKAAASHAQPSSICRCQPERAPVYTCIAINPDRTEDPPQSQSSDGALDYLSQPLHLRKSATCLFFPHCPFDL